MIYYKDGQYKAHTLKANYTSYGQPESQYTSDRLYWQKMVGNWGHLGNLTFDDVILTAEQTARLTEINAHPLLDDLYQAEAAEYVEFGAVQEDCEAPFLIDKIADCTEGIE